jgi:cytochrome c2
VLERLARIYLEKAMSRQDAAAVLKEHGLGDEQAKELHKMRYDADELRLETSRRDESWDDKLKWYIGKKAISALGCFGCHDVPGFEWAKPIGTPLNDWGKKDPERLAFEDVEAFVDEHYYPVQSLTTDKGFGHGPKDDKEPIEQFFLDALKHHQRDGFLDQKLRQPRSFDFNRARTWEDRLRMPQFQFARKAKPLEGESQAQAQQREEAEAREAVMTFILGLVAEPVPLRFVDQLSKDRRAEARGKRVLEKFNCAGCHQLQPGLFEFNLRQPVTGEDGTRTSVLEALKAKYKDVIGSDEFKKDLAFEAAGEPPNALFRDHNARRGVAPANPDRILAHGLPIGADKEGVKLTEALRFNVKKDDAGQGEEGELSPGAYDIPAAVSLVLPRQAQTSQAEPHGGVFTDLLVPYLVARKPSPFLDDGPKARSGLPPPLLREGEKVQPDWLFQFLKHPYPIRRVTILRMPRFNMSDDDAMTLVNYFAAVDRRVNPGISLGFPYEAVPQRNEDFLTEQSRQYLQRLGQADVAKRAEREQLKTQIWERLLRDKIADTQTALAAAQKGVQSASAADKKDAEKRRDALKAELKKYTDEAANKGGPFFQQLRQGWESERAYATDAFRLLTNPNVCLKCHQIGTLEANQLIGPDLDQVSNRLRPEFTERWIASPQRMMIYPEGPHPMPQNFKRDEQEYQGYFAGTPRDQVRSLRDILMNYSKVFDMPENRLYRPTEEVTK